MRAWRSNSAAQVQHWYDGSSRRVAKSERVGGAIQRGLYLSDGWEIVAVMNEAGQLRETFTRGVGLAGDIGTLIAVTHHAGSWTNGTFYIHHNHRGDIVLTRAGTATVGRYDYAAFGAVKSQSGPDVSRFKFSSKERDGSTGFSYYGYRFYSPQWQRWVSRDPLLEEGGINLHGFVRNTPMSMLDPWGLDCWDDFAACMSSKNLCQAALNPLTVLGAALAAGSEPTKGPKGGRRPVIRKGKLAPYPKAVLGRAVGGAGIGALAGILGHEVACYSALLGCLTAIPPEAPYVPPYSGGPVNTPPVVIYF